MQNLIIKLKHKIMSCHIFQSIYPRNYQFFSPYKFVLFFVMNSLVRKLEGVRCGSDRKLNYAQRGIAENRM